MEQVDRTGWKRMDYVNFYSKVWGVPVLPLRPDKRPDVREWASKQNAMPTPQELEGCRDAWGITFILKHNLFALDFDTPEGYELLKHCLPPGACIAKIPRGYHVVVRSSTIVPKTVKGNNPQWLSCLERLSPTLIEVRRDGSRQGKIDLLGNNSLLHSPDSPGYTWLGLYAEPASVPFEEWMKEIFGFITPIPRLTDFIKPSAIGGAKWVNEYCPWCEFDGLPHDSESCSVDVGGGGYKCHGSCEREGKLTEFVEKVQEVGMPLKHGVEIMEAYRRFTTLEVKANQPEFAIPADEQFLFRGDETVKLEQMAEPVVPGVMFRGDIVEFYGQSGTGKTSHQTSATADFIVPSPLFGDWPLPRTYEVLYLDAENPPGETREAVQAAVGEDTGALKRVTIAEMVGLGFDITNPKWYSWLDKQLAGGKYDVVIGDNLGKMTGRNIIDDNEMKTVVNQYLRPLVRKHNILFILVHHTGWERYDTRGRELPSHGKGGSSLFEDVNACFELRKTSKNITRLIVKKIRSRQATIAVGDEFVHYYDRESMKILPIAWTATIDKVEFLVKKVGLETVAARLNCDKSTVSRYQHGWRQPPPEMVEKIAKMASDEGYVRRWTQ